MNTKIRTIQDIRPELFAGNPHEVATTAWWQWRTETAKNFNRPVVVVSKNADGSPLGWVSNEGSLAQEFLSFLRREGSYWFFLDEAHKALAQPDGIANPASNAEEIETLRAQVMAGVELSIDLRAVIIGLRDSVSNALDRIDSKNP